MQKSKLTAIILTAAMLTACTEPNGSPGKGIMNGGALNKEDVGTAVGVVGGGVLGSTLGKGAGKVAATIAGSLLGGVLGNSIGKSMDKADMATYDQASQSAMETGHTKSWKNSETGAHGTIVPHKRYASNDGKTCREYTQTIYVGGEKQQGHGNACREADGSWKIVE